MHAVNSMNKKLKKILPAAAVAGILAIGGTSAYLTDKDSAVNEFTVGKVTIDLEEPSWKPEEQTKIVPLDEIPKDPQIVNTGSNDAYVYLEVRVPVEDLVTAAEDGTRNPLASTQLFTYQINDQWKLIHSESEEYANTYVYAYQKILQPGETTQTLFDQVVFANIIEGQIDNTILEMPVHAYAIQSDHTSEKNTSMEDQTREAYRKYINQNQLAVPINE